jgi:phage shock protein PspC (stress-responsive transcriptional regulator)
VSGAFARATNTDPVLWKVVLVVLTFFGGIGVLMYLLAWLLLPADGDTATPIEALGGRGHSRTSTVRTIIGIVIAALMLAGYVTEPYRATPLVAMVLLGGVLLVLLRDQSRGRGPTAAPPGGAAPYGPVPPAAPPGTPVAPFTAPPAATTPPFAPQGPFAPPPMSPPPMVRWQPPPPPRPRSRLGLLTLSVAVLLLGGLIAADLSGYEIAPLAYFAGPLAVLGLGLLVGTWLGRARWLIPLGIVFMLALGGGYAALGDGYWHRAGVGVIALEPETVEEIPPTYHRNIGAIELDLSRVDFAGTSTAIDVQVDLGAIEITVPSDVDVTVDASVDIGSAVVFDDSWDGMGAGSREVEDLGADGPGGGELHITADINTGSLEIRRQR